MARQFFIDLLATWFCDCFRPRAHWTDDDDVHRPLSPTDSDMLSYRSVTDSSGDVEFGDTDSDEGCWLRIDGIPEGLEPRLDYVARRFHPVHLGDPLGADARYRVLHKLGFGSFGTVWLCRDTVAGRYVAVKVLSADYVDTKSLQQCIPPADFVVAPCNTFSMDGPNGHHRCLVFPWLGPPLSELKWWKMDLDNLGPTLRSYSRQAVEALKFLHQHNICHADFRPENILLKMKNLDHLSEEELLSIIGSPITAGTYVVDGTAVPDSCPQYFVYPVDFERDGLDYKYLADEICVIDFGSAFKKNEAPAGWALPIRYWPPEAFIHSTEPMETEIQDDRQTHEESDVSNPQTTNFEPIDGISSDLWSLGCTLFEIRTQVCMFYRLQDQGDLIHTMSRYFGRPPKAILESWDIWNRSNREKYFNDDGTRTDGTTDDDDASYFEKMIGQPLQIFLPDNDGRLHEKKSEIPREEVALLADLLRKIMHYDPNQRMALDDILNHAWFKFER